MVKLLAGYILIGLGFIGVFYFKGYRGDLIPLPFLWLLVSFGIVILGIFLMVTARTKKQTQLINDSKTQIDQIKTTGERVQVDFDNCDFKTTNYYDQVEESFSKIGMLNALYYSDRNNIERTSTVSYIVYRYQNGDKTEKFVSQPFPFEETTLKYYVTNNNVVLFVDRNDRKKYFFEIEQ